MSTEDLGSYAVEILIPDAFDIDQKRALCRNVAQSVANLIAGLSSVVAERDSMNRAANSLPPVLPNMLVKLRG